MRAVATLALLATGPALGGSALSPRADEAHDPGAALAPAWIAYREHFVEPSGRVVDPHAGNRSTSEGQAYAMVRALWADDRATFDLAWTWMRDNLQSGDPARLPAWLWGQSAAGRWEILDPQPAADADQLAAWALIGGARRWKEPAMAEAASALLAGIWSQETELVDGERVVLPGPWAMGKDPLVFNPSYQLPFAWRTFADFDREHDWASLIGPAYRRLHTCRGSSGLPSDWCYFDRATGARVPPADPRHDEFAFEAFRVGWTLAAEAKWHGDRRARVLLKPFLALLGRDADPVRIPARIDDDGRARADWEYPGMYGALLPAWASRRPGAAAAAWRETLVPLRAPHGWGDPEDYYGQNWIWLGLALWQTEDKPA